MTWRGAIQAVVAARNVDNWDALLSQHMVECPIMPEDPLSFKEELPWNRSSHSLVQEDANASCSRPNLFVTKAGNRAVINSYRDFAVFDPP